MKPCHLTVLRSLETSGGTLVADAVRAAMEDIHIAQMRGDELERELAAARTYIRELESENAGSFW